NWRPKADNLRELASELNLGLDSFVFIDDNPLECAQVRASCPEVLVLQLPAGDAIPQFLANIWAFDKQKVTEEDRKRTAFYREDRDRELFRQQASTLESFLAGLQLEVNISPLAPAELARVSQLTQRTNQFNCTTVRRSEDEIQKACTAGELECLTVCVRDRFGDYGLVGAMMYRAGNGCLTVDTFLLSCRVLGRGVEHRMLRHVGEIARGKQLSRVDVQFIPTKKNAPALSFLDNVAGGFKEDSGESFWFRIPTEYAASLSEVQTMATADAAANAVREQQQHSPAKPLGAARSEVFQEIATALTDGTALLKAIRQ